VNFFVSVTGYTVFLAFVSIKVRFYWRILLISRISRVGLQSRGGRVRLVRPTDDSYDKILNKKSLKYFFCFFFQEEKRVQWRFQWCNPQKYEFRIMLNTRIYCLSTHGQYYGHYVLLALDSYHGLMWILMDFRGQEMPADGSEVITG